MKKIGCTSPFVGNLNNICTDRNNSVEAMQLYKFLIYLRDTINKCSYPCNHFLQIRFRASHDIAPGCESWACDTKAEIQFDKFIKVSTSYYAYTELELLAEFGGYVGLFLGVSIFHLNGAFNKILQLIWHH